jgi:hypothetical protein
MLARRMFVILNLGHCNLPFDFAQGGESFDFAQDREPVERLVEPFVIWILVLEFSLNWKISYIQLCF